MKKTTQNNQETINLGKTISKKFSGGDIVCFTGDLGAGKTTIIKGIIESFGVKKNITSPTFSIMNIYQVPKKINNIKTIAHIDTYRLENENELIEVGINDYLGQPDVLCLIEWPEKIKDLLKRQKIKNIKIKHLAENQRSFLIPDE